LYARTIRQVIIFRWHIIPVKRGQGHVTRYLNIAPNHIFEIGKARHFKFRVMVDAPELSIKWMRSESRDLFKFWEISDNISLRCTMRHSCNGRLMRNRM